MLFSIASLPQFGTTFVARTKIVLYPKNIIFKSLRLNAFQREPASSEFDLHFTTNHISSVSSSTLGGSVFRLILLKYHPIHGQIIQVRVSIKEQIAFNTNLHSGKLDIIIFNPSSLKSIVSSFFNRHLVNPLSKTPNDQYKTISNSFHSPFRVLFHLSFTVLIHYR